MNCIGLFDVLKGGLWALLVLAIVVFVMLPLSGLLAWLSRPERGAGGLSEPDVHRPTDALKELRRDGGP